MANQNPTSTTPHEAWGTVVRDYDSGTLEPEAGDTASLVKAIGGLRQQLAAEFRALKLTLLTGQFVDTQ